MKLALSTVRNKDLGFKDNSKSSAGWQTWLGKSQTWFLSFTMTMVCKVFLSPGCLELDLLIW